MSMQLRKTVSPPPPMKAAGKRGLMSKMPSYNFIYIPNETGASRRISIPKPVVVLMLLALFGLVGAVAALGMNVGRMGQLASDYEKLKAENHSIRSEAAALVSRLQEVQSNLNRVDEFSDQVRSEAAQLDSKPLRGARPVNYSSNEPARKKKRGDTRAAPQAQRSLPPGIGPLTEEEFALSKQPGGISAQPIANTVKLDSLEFKDLFVTLSDIKDKSSEQLESLGSLLRELQVYRSKLDSTPTIAPVDGYVTSAYGLRVSPITGQNRMHQGLDIAAPMGSPIRAAANGTVIRTGVAEDYGNYVEISHGYGVVSRYAHASKILVRAGDKVTKGTLVGKVGMTGRTTGPHLHYEVEVNGRKVNPGNFIR